VVEMEFELALTSPDPLTLKPEAGSLGKNRSK
jgi:hypothetical protein